MALLLLRWDACMVYSSASWQIPILAYLPAMAAAALSPRSGTNAFPAKRTGWAMISAMNASKDHCPICTRTDGMHSHRPAKKVFAACMHSLRYAYIARFSDAFEMGERPAPKPTRSPQKTRQGILQFAMSNSSFSSSSSSSSSAAAAAANALSDGLLMAALRCAFCWSNGAIWRGNAFICEECFESGGENGSATIIIDGYLTEKYITRTLWCALLIQL